MILFASITFVLGYLIGVNLGHERGMRDSGVLTGEDARRFHENMKKAEQYVPTPEEIEERKRNREMMEAILKKSNIK